MRRLSPGTATFLLMQLVALVVYLIWWDKGDPTTKEANLTALLRGLLHGFTVLIAFIHAFSSNKAALYRLQINKDWYNSGYVIGLFFTFAVPFIVAYGRRYYRRLP